MEAVILATDEVVKLPWLRDRLPAPLLPVGGRPAIAATIELVARAGVRRIKICLHQRGGEIMAYVGEGGRWGVQIEYIVLREPLGAAGALRWAAPCLCGPALVLPADLVAEIDLAALIAQHQASGAAVTAVMGQTALAGIAIFEPAALAQLPEGRREIDGELLAELAGAGLAIASQAAKGYLNPLATLADFQGAQRQALQSAWEQEAGAAKGAGRFGRRVAAGVWAGRGSFIHRTARITPPAVIGPGCWVGPEVEIGPEVVLGAHSVVDAGATVRRSTALPQTYIGRLAQLDGRIADRGRLINPLSVDAVCVDDPLLLSEVATGAQWRLAGWAGQLAGGVLLLLAAPLLILLALLAALASRRWPVRRFSYVGARPRRSGVAAQGRAELRLFELQLTRADGSIGALGKWLWQADLHRLPRLLSVASGELALVGVRPLHSAEAAYLSEEWHQTRYTRPAGFTGLWYVQSQSYDLDLIVMADVYYAVTSGWLTDMRVLLQTPLAWLARRLRRREGEPAFQLYQQIAS